MSLRSTSREVGTQTPRHDNTIGVFLYHCGTCDNLTGLIWLRGRVIFSEGDRTHYFEPFAVALGIDGHLIIRAIGESNWEIKLCTP